MSGGSSSLIGAVVQKHLFPAGSREGSSFTVGQDVRSSFITKPALPQAGVHLYGRVIGTACALSSGESAYHVVYEDGDEAYLTDAEVRLWLAPGHHSPILAHATTSTSRPPVSTATRGSSPHLVSTATRRSLTYNTTTSVNHQNEALIGTSPLPRRWESRPSPSHGPMPPRQWPAQHFCGWRAQHLPPKAQNLQFTMGPAESLSLGWRLLVVLLALLVAFSVNNVLVTEADADDWWVGAPVPIATSAVEVAGRGLAFEDDDWCAIAPLPFWTARAKEDMSSVGLGAAWAAANFNYATMS